MEYFLGIDGGGTSTTACVAGSRGPILSQFRAGPSNPVKVGLSAAIQCLLDAARGAMQQAGTRGEKLGGLCAGVAGSDLPGYHRKLLAAFRNSIPAHRYLLTTDGLIALQAALDNGPGVVVISGTGSIAYGRDSRGRILRCGGWGSLFDDEGSGHDLGRKAIGCALRSFDGRGPRTRLSAALCRSLKLSSITEVAERSLQPHEIAGLFPLIERAAEKGDAVARGLLEQGGCDLAHLAWTLLKRLGSADRDVPVVCTGGIFKASPRVRQSFAVQLASVAPQARVRLLHREAVCGALDLARWLAAKPQLRARAAQSGEAATKGA
jgi:N-acetylglucosamine kinase-like BadF-type ATPase